MDREKSVILQDDNQEIDHPGETIKTMVVPGDPNHYLIQRHSEEELTLPSSNAVPKPASGDDHTVISRVNIPTLGTQQTEFSTLKKSDNEHLKVRTCDDEFILLNLIGEGGQGQIWEALQVGLGRKVALKRATKKDSIHEEFIKEAFVSAQLDHPNIVPVYDLGFTGTGDQEVPLLSMKRVVGIPWKQLLQEDRYRKKMPLDEFLAKHLPIFEDVLNAVAYAHSKRVIHRDLKPSQVMVGDFGEVYLLDWGLSIYLDKQKGGRKIDPLRVFTLTTASNPAGTPSYMAPEQADFHTGKLGLHTDIYLLGSILYELLSGHPPHQPTSGKLKLSTIRSNVIEPLLESCPKDLHDITMKCLALDPELRPKSVWEIKKAVEGYLSGSNRKSESKALTDALASLDPSVLDNYDELSRQSQVLSQAFSLWPLNPDVDFCRNMILAAYVSVSLKNGDLLLAQVQADRVDDHEWSNLLRMQVDEARQASAKAFPEPPFFTRLRVLILVITYALLLAVLGGFVNVTRETLLSETTNRVQALASLAAESLSSDNLTEVSRTRDIQTSPFQEVFNQLITYKRSNSDIDAVYTMVPDFAISPKTWRFLVSSDPLDWDGADALNKPGSLYDQGNPAMQTAFQDMVITTSFEEREEGFFVSGFAPVVSPESNESVALVVVDIKSSSIQEKLRNVYLAATIGGVFLFLLVTATLYAFIQSRRTLEKLRIVEEENSKQNSALRGKKIHL